MLLLAITVCHPQRKNFISYRSLSFLREVSVLQQQSIIKLKAEKSAILPMNQKESRYLIFFLTWAPGSLYQYSQLRRAMKKPYKILSITLFIPSECSTKKTLSSGSEVPTNQYTRTVSATT